MQVFHNIGSIFGFDKIEQEVISSFIEQIK